MEEAGHRRRRREGAYNGRGGGGGGRGQVLVYFPYPIREDDDALLAGPGPRILAASTAAFMAVPEEPPHKMREREKREMSLVRCRREKRESEGAREMSGLH